MCLLLLIVRQSCPFAWPLDDVPRIVNSPSNDQRDHHARGIPWHDHTRVQYAGRAAAFRSSLFLVSRDGWNVYSWRRGLRFTNSAAASTFSRGEGRLTIYLEWRVRAENDGLSSTGHASSLNPLVCLRVRYLPGGEEGDVACNRFSAGVKSGPIQTVDCTSATRQPSPTPLKSPCYLCMDVFCHPLLNSIRNPTRCGNSQCRAGTAGWDALGFSCGRPT